MANKQNNFRPRVDEEEYDAYESDIDTSDEEYEDEKNEQDESNKLMAKKFELLASKTDLETASQTVLVATKLRNAFLLEGTEELIQHKRYIIHKEFPDLEFTRCYPQKNLPNVIHVLVYSENSRVVSDPSHYTDQEMDRVLDYPFVGESDGSVTFIVMMTYKDTTDSVFVNSCRLDREEAVTGMIERWTAGLDALRPYIDGELSIFAYFENCSLREIEHNKTVSRVAEIDREIDKLTAKLQALEAERKKLLDTI